ncbi:TPA: hypothetical protein HA265_01500 [Candidatus Woesearchaeota archaeon]|nr:hypothetical protein [Candidatus Woesearchaeota archaeon]
MSRKSILRKYWLAISLATGVPAAVGALEYSEDVRRHNRRIEQREEERARRRTLEERMFNTIVKEYSLSPDSVCNHSQPLFRKGDDHFVVVHGSDSRKYFMEALKLDVGAWAGMARRLGYSIVEVCSDVHEKSYWEKAMSSLADSTTSGTRSGLFISSHGIPGDEVRLQFQGGSEGRDSGHTRSSSSETVTISTEEINKYLARMEGEFEGFFDNCFALDDFVKGTQVDSSDKKTPSYWASHVKMGYFTMAVAYTMITENYSSSLKEVTYRMVIRDPSLPKEVLQLMEDNPEAFATMQIREHPDTVVAKVDSPALSEKVGNSYCVPRIGCFPVTGPFPVGYR